MQIIILTTILVLYRIEVVFLISPFMIVFDDFVLLRKSRLSYFVLVLKLSSKRHVYSNVICIKLKLIMKILLLKAIVFY